MDGNMDETRMLLRMEKPHLYGIRSLSVKYPYSNNCNILINNTLQGRIRISV